MEVYIICNNLFENNLSYPDKDNIEIKKMCRPLSVEGEEIAKNVSLLDELSRVTLIFSSMYASALGSAKYLAERNNKTIIVEEGLNDCKIGNLENRPLKMIRFMQNHDFDIKNNGGESLNEVKDRVGKVFDKIVYLNNNKRIAVFTHKRSLLGLLLRYGTPAYNLEDNLVVEYNDKVIYDESDKDVDIIKITLENKQVVDIDVIDI